MPTALDTETSLSSNREPIARLACVSFAGAEGVQIMHASDPRIEGRVIEVLDDGIVLANGPYDLAVLSRARPGIWPAVMAALEGGRVFDVLTREKYLDIADGQHRKRGPYNLGAVAGRRAGLRVDKADKWRRRYGALIDVPIDQWPEGAIAYAQWDAWATWCTYLAQERVRHAVVHGQPIDLFADTSACARAHFALYVMTLRGIHTDPEQVARIDALYSARIAKLEARALECGLAERKHTSFPTRCSAADAEGRCAHVVRKKARAQAAIAAWCRDLGREPVRNDVTTKAAATGATVGAVSLAKKALEAAGIPRGRWGLPDKRPGEDATTLYDRAHAPDEPWPATVRAHALEVYRELGGTRALYSKNIPVLKHPVIRTRYDECVSSGRTSASGFKRVAVADADDDEDDDGLEDFDCELEPGDEWVGTNTQNFNREGGLRECLVPPPPDEWSGPAGYMFGMTDYGALELVTDAQDELDLFGCSALAEVLRAGRCPHSTFGAKVLRIAYELFDKKRKDHNGARQLGKAWNFGKKGAMGKARFLEWAWTAYELRIASHEFDQYDREWHESRPEVRRSWAYTKTLQTGVDAKGRPLFTVIQPRTKRVRGGCGFPDANNTRYQGLGADVAKRAAWLLFKAQFDASRPLYRCPQVMFEHDAFVTAIPRRLCHQRPDGSLWSDALDEQERIMIAASRELCPDVPMKVESALVDRFQK